MSLIKPKKKKSASKRLVPKRKSSNRRVGALCPLCAKWIPNGITKHKEEVHGEQSAESRAAALRKEEALRLEKERKTAAEFAAAEEIRDAQKRKKTIFDLSKAGTRWGADKTASSLRPKKK